MTDRTPLILVPGLLCDSLLWANQIGALGDLADCQVANPVNHDSIKGMASDVLHRTQPQGHRQRTGREIGAQEQGLALGQLHRLFAAHGVRP